MISQYLIKEGYNESATIFQEEVQINFVEQQSSQEYMEPIKKLILGFQLSF